MSTNDKHILYLIALRSLLFSSDVWLPNFNAYARWDMDRRQRWIDYIERQAKNGLPMAQTLVAEVAKVRLKG